MILVWHLSENLKEAIEELKIEDFQELYPDRNQPEKCKSTLTSKFFPDTYINNVQERLSCYQSLNKVTNQTDSINLSLS